MLEPPFISVEISDLLNGILTERRYLFTAEDRDQTVVIGRHNIKSKHNFIFLALCSTDFAISRLHCRLRLETAFVGGKNLIPK